MGELEWENAGGGSVQRERRAGTMETQTNETCLGKRNLLPYKLIN